MKHKASNQEKSTLRNVASTSNSRPVFPRWTEPRLNLLFRRFNARFWDGKLPAYEVVIGELGREYLAECDATNCRITFDPDTILKDEQSVLRIMLHEMAHAAVPECADHGSPWQAEMSRLIGLTAGRLKANLIRNLEWYRLGSLIESVEREFREQGRTSPGRRWRARLLEEFLHQLGERADGFWSASKGTKRAVVDTARKWYRKGQEEIPWVKELLRKELMDLECESRRKGQSVLPFEELN